MHRETAIVLVTLGIVMLSTGVYIYVVSAVAPLFSVFQGICNSVLGQAAESLIPDASSTCLRVNAEAGIAKSAVGVSYVLMVVGPLMAGAGGLNLGRELRSNNTQDWA
jgi:MFS family permease